MTHLKQALAMAFLLALAVTTVLAQENPLLRTTITVQDLTTGQLIKRGETINAVDTVQITVTTNGVNCAGQVAVTALGITGAPPEVGVVSAPFTIGPATSNSFSLSPFYVGVLPSGENDWKISSSCNGASRGQFDFGKFEFFVNINAD
jgi:hypothetical protein